MDLEQLRQAGFNDGQINEYVLRKTTTLQAAGFSDEEINSHLGITLPDQFFPVKQGANSALQRVRNYLGIPTEERKYGTQKVYDPFKQPKSGEVVYGEAQDYADAEILRVMDKFVSGVSGGISDLIFGGAEKPETVAGTIAGAGAELAGFIVGPVKASKFLLGSRLAPTATGLKKMAQILAHGGATLGIASGLSSIIPSFLESKDFADMGLNILESTSMGALTGMIYPGMGVVPTKPLRMAATLAVMDKIRAGTGQWFTLDDFITGLKDGTVDKKELSKMAFGYLMDLYFAAKTPSIRTQLKSLEGIGAKIRELDPDETAQAVLDIVNNDSVDQRIRTLGLNRAVQYEGKTYPAEAGEIHVQIIDRNGLPINEKVKDGYVDKEGNFHSREEVVEALNTGINYFLGDFVEADGDCWFQDARWHSIIWVHPDMRFESQPDWWLRLMTFLDDHPDVWKVGPNSYNLEGEPDDRPGNTCPWAMPIEAFKHLAKDANRSYPGDPTYRMRGQFFDENYQRCHNYDDWDLNRRIIDLGKKVWITKQSKVWHKGMGSRGTYQDTGGWGQQNAGLYVKKWATNKSPV